MSAYLALDTSGPTARIALVDAGGTCLASGERTSLRHSATLLPLLHELLGRAGLVVPNLRGIACGAGPGSFTGLRVGLAVAKGLALAFDLPLVLVPSLTALAVDLAAGGATGLIAPCIDAGKGEVYVQLFRAGSADPVPLGPELRTTAEIFAAELAGNQQTARFAGTGADRQRAAITAVLGETAVVPDFPGPSALAIARLALPRLLRGEHDDLDSAVPAYGRPPDITTPKPKPPPN